MTTHQLEHVLSKSRGGRPRRQGVERDEHGRIDRTQYHEDPRTLPAWNRYRDNVHSMMLDPRMATQRGKLFYTKHLTPVEFETANRWADMLEGYDILILGRKRTPASPALERIGFGQGHEGSPDTIERFRERFMAAHKALLDAGKIVEVAVSKLCRDEAGAAHLPMARTGLSALAVHFGMVKGKRK